MSRSTAVAPASSESIGLLFGRLVSGYTASTPLRARAADSLVALAVVAAGVQLVYCLLLGNFPFNSFLSGFFAALGVAVLTVSLRMQITDEVEFVSQSPYQAFAEYMLCCVVLFLAVLNYIG